MSFYVYIIANAVDADLYKGLTENPGQRLLDHNEGRSAYSSTKEGWYYVFLKKFEFKREALIYEKRIKRLNRNSLLKLISSTENTLHEYLGG